MQASTMPDSAEGRSNARIALYVPSLRGGGAERVMLSLANGFSSRGYQVDLVLAKAEGPYLDDVGDSVRIVDLKSSRVIASLPGLIRYLRNERPVALLSAMGHANVVSLAARALARVSTRVVVSEHSTFTLATENADSWRSGLVGGLMRWAYPRADAIVAVSSGVADDLAQSIGIPRDRIAVVYNPIVNDKLIDQSFEDPGHPWMTAEGIPVVLGVGRLTKAKDFVTLIKAFAQVRKERQARLLILGEGELRTELEELVTGLSLTGDVDLPGFMQNPFSLMRQSDLFVLSSAWEGLPSVLIQAMACSTPVVSTNCPSGPSEILEGGRWGRLVPVGDVGALAKAINTTLDHRDAPDVAARALSFNLPAALDGYENVLFARG